MTVQESSHEQPGAITHRDEYHPDLPSVKHTLLGIVVAALGGLVFTLACWFVLKTTNLPAFGPSMVSRALATFSTIILLAAVATVVVLWVMDEKKKTQRPFWRTALTYVLCYLSPAGLVVTSTAIPLSATRLYLDGITVDQGFRTQFMTRLADSWALSDMNYIDLPTFYPGMWFWFGGRVANVLDIPGWEVFQPWSLMSIAAAGCVLVPVWQRLVGSLPVATGIALVSVAITLVMSAEEPYAAIIALGVPAACILARRALVGRNLAMVGLIIYLGMSASAYTLYTAVVALSTIVIAALYAAVLMKSATPIIRLIIIGVASMAIAAIWWGPYVLAILDGHPASGATAAHYLPLEGTQVPLPMLAPTLIGILCLVGLVYMIMRASNYDVRMLGIGLMVFYGWVALSMAFTVTGTTLLGFRLDVVVALQLATAGVLGFAELRIYSIHRLFPEAFDVKTSRTITVVFVAVLMAAGLAYAQNIPNDNADAIDRAYTDTDGYGERADLYPPDSTQYYAEVADHIAKKRGKLPRDTVILTDERNFMSYHPFRGFQAFTSHYANPLGEFDRRNEAITSWALGSWNKFKTPQSFVEKLDEAEWKAPEAFVFRADLESTIEDMNSSKDSTGWVFDLAEDIYPNNPNVRFHGVRFNPEVFLGSGTMWDATQIGPFVVVTRS
ncbi:MAG: galactan 5-O-arabinofuranosyltransferase [Corynebacterium sp.]|uniref:galactan 5-O-arabinofuranosyltransferase n=1 Tax=Corynebacterium sp. TaxID=1720 RepID=UPI0026DB160D|nr:galactan 5-O-arabinofuranosyltransferase [Corynebacterium sp.]MDO5099174.1 galactan 5-O-arabinofuranosyltransferase [Corynebacterium sp.]